MTLKRKNDESTMKHLSTEQTDRIAGYKNATNDVQVESWRI